MVLAFVGLFLAGFCLVALPRGVGQIVTGTALVVMSLTIAAMPDQAPAPTTDAQPGQPVTMQVSAP